jgi:hypothetical protein
MQAAVQHRKHFFPFFLFEKFEVQLFFRLLDTVPVILAWSLKDRGYVVLFQLSPAGQNLTLPERVPAV